MKAFILASIFFGLISTHAEARSHHHRHVRSSGLSPECNVTMPCVAPYASTPAQVRATRGKYVASQMGFGGPVTTAPRRHYRKARRHNRHLIHVAKAAAGDPTARTEIVSHPEGCPRTAFCGCGAAVKVFGAPIRNLWLAANWFKFPRATPAPGMVAVRQHHVMVLQAHLGGGVWEVYDANSGRHMTRIHARSIAGYAIVNPRG